MKEVKKPEWYYVAYWTSPDFGWKFFGFGVYIGRVREVGDDLVFNVYTPWFSFGYAW